MLTLQIHSYKLGGPGKLTLCVCVLVQTVTTGMAANTREDIIRMCRFVLWVFICDVLCEVLECNNSALICLQTVYAES